MSTIKISELATSAISLTDFFAKADASGLANKNTMQGLSNFLNTVGTLAYRGVLLAADAAVTLDGIYVAGDDGTYTNNGGLVITLSNQIVLISITETQTVFEKVEIPVSIVKDAIPTEGSTNAVESGGVFDALALKPTLIAGKNKFDKSLVTLGFFIINDGQTGASATLNISGFIPVTVGSQYVSNYPLSSTCYFDENEVVVSGGSNSTISTFTVPAGASFIKATSVSANLNSIQLELGSTSTYYENYQIAVKKSEVNLQDVELDFNKIGVPIELAYTFTTGTFIGANGEVASYAPLSSSDFFPIKEGIYHYNGRLISTSYIAFYDKNYNFISSFLNPNSPSDAFIFDVTAPENSAYCRVSCGNDYTSIFSFANSLLERVDFLEDKSFTNVFTNIITVDSLGGGDFTTIDAAMRSITDASDINRYVVNVAAGTYNEIWIANHNYQGENKDVVQLIGDDKSNTFLIGNGASTDISPSDYYYPAYANTAYNLIPASNKDIISLQRSMTVKNLTIRSIDCRYPVHGDYNEDGTPRNYLIEDCFLDGNSFAGIGLGLFENQYYNIKDCDFRISILNQSQVRYGVYCHNRTNSPALGIDVSNCNFDNCGIVNLDENGGTTDWYANITDCVSNDKYNGIYLTDNISDAHANRLILNVNNCEYNFIDNDEGRIISDKCKDLKSHITAINNSGVTISKGDILEFDFTNVTSEYINVKKGTSTNIDAIAIIDILNTNTNYIQLITQTFKANAETGTFTRGQKLSVLNGILIADVSGNYISLESKTLGSIGLLKVTKI